MSDFSVSPDVLLGWLDNDPDRLERHLTDHPEDADRLDLLTALPELAGWLADTLVVPVELAEKVRALVQGDPARREAGKVIAELLGTSWRTAALLWSDEELS